MSTSEPPDEESARPSTANMPSASHSNPSTTISNNFVSSSPSVETQLRLMDLPSPSNLEWEFPSPEFLRKLNFIDNIIPGTEVTGNEWARRRRNLEAGKAARAVQYAAALGLNKAQSVIAELVELLEHPDPDDDLVKYYWSGAKPETDGMRDKVKAAFVEVEKQMNRAASTAKKATNREKAISESKKPSAALLDVHNKEFPKSEAEAQHEPTPEPLANDYPDAYDRSSLFDDDEEYYYDPFLFEEIDPDNSMDDDYNGMDEDIPERALGPGSQSEEASLDPPVEAAIAYQGIAVGNDVAPASYSHASDRSEPSSGTTNDDRDDTSTETSTTQTDQGVLKTSKRVLDTLHTDNALDPHHVMASHSISSKSSDSRWPLSDISPNLGKRKRLSCDNEDEHNICGAIYQPEARRQKKHDVRHSTASRVYYQQECLHVYVHVQILPKGTASSISKKRSHGESSEGSDSDDERASKRHKCSSSSESDVPKRGRVKRHTRSTTRRHRPLSGKAVCAPHLVAMADAAENLAQGTAIAPQQETGARASRKRAREVVEDVEDGADEPCKKKAKKRN